jgi:PAS domain S-box-containing protein
MNQNRAPQPTRELDVLFRLSGVGVVQTDLRTGRFARVNRTFCDMVGYREAELLGMTYRELTHPDDRQRDAATFEAFGRGELKESRAVTRCWHKSGVVVWLELHVTVLHEGDETINVAVANDVTERVRAEEALRESEVFSRTVLESSPDCVKVLDGEGRLLFMNANGLCLLELDDFAAVEHRPWWSLWREEERAVVRGAVAAALRGETTRFQASTPTTKGKPRWWDVVVAPVGGTPPRLVCVSRDVTESKRMEEVLRDFNATLERRVKERTQALQESERRFAQTFSAGPVATCITTLGDETFLDVNEAFSRLTGYSREEAVGKSYEELDMWSSPEDQAKLREAQASQAGVHNLELQLRTKAGETRDISLSSGVIRLGAHYGHLRMFYDVTRRKEAEAWRELLRGAMDNAEETVIITTADLDAPGPRIIYVNAAFTKMTGYEPEEVMGGTPRMFQGSKTDRTVLRRMRRTLRLGRAFQGESVNYRKDGTPFTLSWNVAPIRDAQGAVTHFVSIQHDVSERRALERELLDTSAREQRRIAADLHDTVQQQLIGTAMQAKRLHSDVKLRAPELADDLHELYTLIQDGVRSVRTVLGGITPVQPTENGLMVALESMCQRVAALFRTPCTFSFEQPLLMHDFERATHLYYIAQEAAINAAKHAGATRIDVRLSGTGTSYTLTVTDDGKGVGEAARRRGGMGLNLMEYRAKLLGVGLELRSAPGQGTTVSFSFDAV